MKHSPLVRPLLLLALLLIAGTISSAVSAAQPPYTATPINPAVHRVHEAYYILQHNTFDYGATLTGWLDAGFRSVELDIIDKEDWELNANGPYVSHDASAGNKNCSGNPDRLGHCLQDIANWLNTHPGEGPVLVFVDMKASWDPANAWHNDEVYLLDEKVRSILGPRLYTADELYQYAAGVPYTPGGVGLRQVVSTTGWPTLGSLAGRVIVAYTGGKIGLVNQTQGGGIEYIMSRPGRSLPYGFFCPDVESDPAELQPGGTVDGMSQATSQQIVCSNLQSRDHYQITANMAATHRQLIHLWGNHVYNNNEFNYNYIAVAHGISAIGRDNGASETWGGALPLVGVRRSLPGYFEVRPLHAQNKCMDVSGSGTGNGTKIQLWDCNGSNAQRFVYTAEGQLRPKHYNPSCTDIKGGDAGNGAIVHLWDCDGGVSEKWVIDPSGLIKSNDDNRAFCLAVSGGGTANGTRFVTYTCNSASNSQKFRLEPVPDWPQSQF